MPVGADVAEITALMDHRPEGPERWAAGMRLVLDQTALSTASCLAAHVSFSFGSPYRSLNMVGLPRQALR